MAPRLHLLFINSEEKSHRGRTQNGQTRGGRIQNRQTRLWSTRVDIINGSSRICKTCSPGTKRASLFREDFQSRYLKIFVEVWDAS